MESLGDPGPGLSAFCSQQPCGHPASGHARYHWVWIHCYLRSETT